MIQELKITITISTDTTGDAKVLMIERLGNIIVAIQNGREGGNIIIGDIDEVGYEIHCKWDITQSE